MTYDQWHAMSFALVLLGLIAYATSWRGADETRERWQYRQAVLNTPFWGGWLIADLTRHHYWWAGADAVLLALALFSLDQWRRSTRKTQGALLGYKSAAIRERLARGSRPEAATYSRVKS